MNTERIWLGSPLSLSPRSIPPFVWFNSHGGAIERKVWMALSPRPLDILSLGRSVSPSLALEIHRYFTFLAPFQWGAEIWSGSSKQNSVRQWKEGSSIFQMFRFLSWLKCRRNMWNEKRHLNHWGFDLSKNVPAWSSLTIVLISIFFQLYFNVSRNLTKR